jgi:uncharacterized protein YjeT (DUF2065 family)
MSSIMIASILGVYLVVSGLFLILRSKTVPMLLHDFLEHRAVMYLAGACLLLVGGLIVFGEYKELWVRIVGWAVLIKGIMYILTPEQFKKLSKKFGKGSVKFLGVVSVALGVWLLKMSGII